VRAARSRTGLSSETSPLVTRSQAAAAATATRAGQLGRWRAARSETSAAENTAVSPASRAIAASATPRNGQRQAQPDGPVSPGEPGTGGAGPGAAGTGEAGPGDAGSGIAGQAPAGIAAQHGLDDPRLPGSSSILRRRFFTCESTVRS